MEIRSFSSLSRVKIDQRTASPPPLHALFASNTSDKNFELAILLKIVQRSYNKNFGVDTLPEGPWEGL